MHQQVVIVILHRVCQVDKLGEWFEAEMIPT